MNLYSLYCAMLGSLMMTGCFSVETPPPATSKSPISETPAKNTPIPSPTPPPVTLPDVRAVAHNMVLFCWKDGQLIADSACPAQVRQIGVSNVANGPVRIEQMLSTISSLPKDGLDEPCGNMRIVESSVSAPAITVEGREMKLHDPKSKSYRTRLAETAGMADPPVEQLVRIDLDGDGTEEVLFVINSHSEWMVNGPDTILSMVGIRAVVDGEVKTQLIHNTRDTIAKGQSAHYWLKGTIAGITDIEGDGCLEVVISSEYYEGASAGVYQFNGKELILIGENGCGA